MGLVDGGLRFEGTKVIEITPKSGIGIQRAQARDQVLTALSNGKSDAGALTTIQLNLAGVLKIRGDIAGAIEHYEAAVDIGRRSGRRAGADRH